ncbi:NAD-dependent epimerase/dehydratase family protein [Microdochium nivale]|nr:NAD-dependent epimerase/dehydratase family protein [Microdochium nivale]
MASKTVFYIGPGFIGSEVLQHLITEGYHVTVLTRSELAANTLRERFGSNVKTVQGTLADAELITKHASESDIVIHTATADDLPSVQAVLAGIKQRAAADPLARLIYIHTSGAALLMDDSKGDFKADKIADDATPNDIDALPDSAPHRNVDLAILRAREELSQQDRGSGIVIMIPPIIDGVGSYGGGRLSIQVPSLVRFALKHGYAGYVGKGFAVWPYVHVRDLAEAYMTLLHYVESAGSDQAARTDLAGNPYFFAESGEEASWRDIAGVIGRELHRQGRINSPEPRTIPEAQYNDLHSELTYMVVGANARHRASRLRKLGWEARQRKFADEIAQEVVPAVLKE